MLLSCKTTVVAPAGAALVALAAVGAAAEVLTPKTRGLLSAMLVMLKEPLLALGAVSALWFWSSKLKWQRIG